MQKTLEQIRDYLNSRKYRNEEHVRLSLVCRILYELGWDIWNPDEVNAEFSPNKEENNDNKRVDLALFINKLAQIFIEVKNADKLKNSANLEKAEKQLTEYNSHNKSAISIITSGADWKFYYAPAQGRFSDRRFKEFNFQTDDLNDIDKILRSFLSKEEVTNGSAKKRAEEYQRLNRTERQIEECLSDANKQVQLAPFPTMPQAILDILKEQGTDHLTEEEVKKHLENIDARCVESTLPKATTPPTMDTSSKQAKSDSDTLSVKHSHLSGTIMSHTVERWNPFLRKVIAIALADGHTLHSLKNQLPLAIKEGKHDSDGFLPIPGDAASLQAVEAEKSYKALCLLAKILKRPIDLEITFDKKSSRAGEIVRIRLEP